MSTSLSEAREWLEERIDDGVACPCCDQFAKRYRRKLHTGLAVFLIRMYRHSGRRWVHALQQIADRNTIDYSKLTNWGLIESAPRPIQPDAKRTSGIYRVTELGERFVLDHERVPSHVIIYNGQVERLDGPMISIREALGKKFNYAELMRGEG